MENLYVKIQTLPDYSEKALELYFKKYKESNNLSSLKEAEEDFYKNAGKNPLFGYINSVTIGYTQDNTIRVKVLKGAEEDIIKELLNITSNSFFGKHQICAWNFSFILPFLRIRAKKNKIRTPFHKDLVDQGKKAWTITGLDLFDFHKGMGWFSSSLEEVAELTFGLPTEFIDGEDVYSYFKAGKHEELDNSSIKEMVTLINVHRGIKDEDFLEEVTTDVAVLGEVKEEKTPVLKKLYNTSELTNPIKEELKELVGKKKMTKKDKELFFTLLRGVMVREDFISGDQDNKATIEKKESSINEFIATL